MRQVVVFVHGIWMIGSEMGLLRRRVQACGFKTHQFRYNSLLKTPAQNAARLNAFIKTLDADIVHLVAHSLGGVVLLHLFDAFPDQRPGRVVMLAAPLKGSALAGIMHRNAFYRPLLGRSAERGVLGDAPRWKAGRDLGIIAGDRGVGMGMLVLGGLERPHDGTVRIHETRINEATAHLIVPHSHFSMLFSSGVARQVCAFLETGHFED